MTILTVNTGSSSVRLAAFVRRGNELIELATIHHDLAAGGEPRIVLHEFIQSHSLTGIDVSVHRVVHGGANLTASCLLNQDVEREIDRLALLAPLHNPVSLRWIHATHEVLGKGITQVAVFDTAFFTLLPEIAQTYAIPTTLVKKHGLRRYGFHGLAHQAMWRQWCELQPHIPRGGRLVSMQLGSGCSISAIDRGVPRDTSMGFSPLEGLMMATRSGDMDPGLLTFLQRQEGLTSEQIDRLLNEKSGLLGVSGISADMRQLLESQDEHARLAVELYCYRARKYLGAYLAVLGGAEAIVFGGGVGENAPEVRKKILEGMEWCGIEIDSKKNYGPGKMLCISNETSRVQVWIIPVNEALILAREAEAVIAAKGAKKRAEIF
ncbi:MAG: acetate/propionate family kinase [Nitrosospira sp.]|nr:acetate/propionate family kinase [Nitrosospira sp.]